MTVQESGKTHPAQRARDLEQEGEVRQRPSFFDIFLDPATMADPYPLYQRLLAERPVQADHGLPIVLTSYADVAAALEHPGLSTDDRRDANLQAMVASGALSKELASMLDRRSFLRRDPPEHTRLRRLTGRAVSPARVERLRPAVQRLTDQFIDAAIERGSLELIADLAYPLPLAVTGQLLGLQLAVQPDAPWWRSQLCADFEAPAVAGEECAGFAHRAQEQMIAHFDEAIAARRGKSGDDVVSDLIMAENSGELSPAEVNDTCRLLAIAAHETTTSLIANGMLAFLRNPAQIRLLQDEPSLAASAVEEVLRHDTPIQFVRRIAVTDVEVNGIPVPAGRMVMALIGAANRDPAHFGEPGRFDVRRPRTGQLGFGAGIHACPGTRLALMQAEIALATLCRRLVNPKLATDPPGYLPNAIHAIAALPIEFQQIRPAASASAT